MLLTKGINFKNFASEIKGDAKLLSKEQSVSRFLKNKDLIGMEEFHQFMFKYFPSERMVLSIDRTNWERGKKIYNIMVIAVSFHNISMPVTFTVFNHKGASTSLKQIAVLKKFVKKFGKDRIEAVVADREFDGGKFIKYLNRNQINFVIRARAGIGIEFSGKKLLIGNAPYTQNLPCNYLGSDINFTKIKIKQDKHLSLISSKNLDNPVSIYKKRWDIETAFKGCKSNGFQLEQTHITNSTRFINLLKCLFISYAIAINTGWKNLTNNIAKIKFKKTLKTYERSILQHGLYLLKQSYAISKSHFNKIITKNSRKTSRDLNEFLQNFVT
ncbi:MAG: transposase [Rickettsiales bacterium]|nr:transposase [Rickettsiales bacterium]